MADHKKMYMILCHAVDAVIDPLEQIPLAMPQTAILRNALLEAENVYLNAEPEFSVVPLCGNIHTKK